MATKTRGAPRSAPKELDAIALLVADHRKVHALFDRYNQSDDDGEKGEICQQVCAMLTVHAAIEEEIFYPAARDALDDSDLLDTAEAEHDVARSLIEQLQEDDLRLNKRDATFGALSECVDLHTEEEESELFAQVRKSSLDLYELADEMRSRKKELEDELGLADEGDEGDEEEVIDMHFSRMARAR